jgi:acyl dehydratase
MPVTTRLTWDELSAGQRLGTFRPPFDARTVNDFREVVDPAGTLYTEGAEPALAYDTLHAVKEFVELPQGTVHAKEAVRFHSPIDPAAPCTVDVSVASRSVRRGRRSFVVEYDVRSGAARVMSAYKSFTLPGTADTADTEPGPEADFGLFSHSPAEGIEMRAAEIPVTQGLIDDFGRVSATDGPIHTDPAVATPLFGGTILQGMLVFETASQLMARLSSAREWLTSGTLAAKIVGSTITGERLRVVPTLTSVANTGTPRARCSITATTDTGRTVFVARADAPLTAISTLQENRA